MCRSGAAGGSLSTTMVAGRAEVCVFYLASHPKNQHPIPAFTFPSPGVLAGAMTIAIVAVVASGGGVDVVTLLQ